MIIELLNKQLGINEAIPGLPDRVAENFVHVVENVERKSADTVITGLSFDFLGTAMIVVSTALIAAMAIRLIFSNWKRMGAGIRFLILHAAAFIFALGLLKLHVFWSKISYGSFVESGYSIAVGAIGITLVHHLYVFSKNTAEFQALMASIFDRFNMEVLPKIHTGVWKWTFSTETEPEKLEWDATMHQIFGSDPKAFNERYGDFARFVHPEDLDGVNKAVTEAINRGTIFNYKMRVTNHAGGWKIMHGRGGVICDSHGKPIYMAGFSFPE